MKFETIEQKLKHTMKMLSPVKESIEKILHEDTTFYFHNTNGNRIDTEEIFGDYDTWMKTDIETDEIEVHLGFKNHKIFIGRYREGWSEHIYPKNVYKLPKTMYKLTTFDRQISEVTAKTISHSREGKYPTLLHYFKDKQMKKLMAKI